MCRWEKEETKWNWTPTLFFLKVTLFTAAMVGQESLGGRKQGKEEESLLYPKPQASVGLILAGSGAGGGCEWVGWMGRQQRAGREGLSQALI